MKIIYLLLVISAFFTGCKFNRNNNIDFTVLHDDILSSDFIYEKPIIIINKDNKFLEFPNSYIINISEKYCQYKIDYIKIYNTNDKKSPYIEVKNEDVFLLKLPENNNWLYCYVSDFIHGFLYIYDISKESFYGNFDNNRESGNTYKKLLIDEYILANKYSNIKRYGPLLEIKYKYNVIKFWDSFTGENTSCEYRYQLLDYYEGSNEILIRKQLCNDSKDYIYNIKTAGFVCEIENS